MTTTPKTPVSTKLLTIRAEQLEAIKAENKELKESNADLLKMIEAAGEKAGIETANQIANINSTAKPDAAKTDESARLAAEYAALTTDKERFLFINAHGRELLVLSKTKN